MGKNPLEYSKKYSISYRNLSSQDQLLTKEAIAFFREQEDHPSLRNHTLRNQLSSLKSIAVHDDLRVLLRIRSDGSILLVDVGGHEMVYRDM
jgi:mRNA-degrading endonuclease YafQ of YafQ-DinJ toxin-antitoxin module